MSTEHLTEAMNKAERAAEKYGEVWHIADPGQAPVDPGNEGYYILPDSYFTDQAGRPRNTPFTSLYNTIEKKLRS